MEPGSLSAIFSREEILSIGMKYRELSGESSPDTLLQLLKGQNEGMLTGQMDVIIASDFENNRTVMINGWLLSITEARQCALYSLKESPKK